MLKFKLIKYEKIVFIVVMSVFALACKPKQTVTNTKLDNKSERLIKEIGKFSSVSYVGSDVFKVTSFNIADAKCLKEVNGVSFQTTTQVKWY